MRRRILIMTVAVFLPVLVLGRAVQMLDISTLVTKSTLVFVGRVETTVPSGIKTTMSYPTWKGVTFEWLNCDIEVVEPLKGAKKGEIIRTAMLSVSSGRLSFNPPGMVDPERGKAYLLCLAPTTLSNTYAAITAPWDDEQAIFVLDRDFWKYGNYRKNGKETFGNLNERYGVIWNLVDEKGRLLPAGAEQIRKTYKTQIASSPPTNSVIHLQWETQELSSGWQWDVPKGYSNSTNSKVISGRHEIFTGGKKSRE